VPRELQQECPQLGIDAWGHIKGSLAAEDCAQPLTQYTRLTERDGVRRSDPPRVAPGGARGDVVAFDHRDVATAFLEEPRGGQADDARADHDDLARRARC